jgi:hypothetical protein
VCWRGCALGLLPQPPACVYKKQQLQGYAAASNMLTQNVYWVYCCSHLPVLASALASLNASNLDSQQHATPSSSSSSSSATAAADQQPQPPDQPAAATAAAAESARALLLELCEAVQQIRPSHTSFGAPQVARFVSAMARLGHYDWQAMRHVCVLAEAHAKVGSLLAYGARFVCILAVAIGHDPWQLTSMVIGCTNRC